VAHGSDPVIATFDAGPFQIAEGPVWDGRTGTLLWVDIPNGVICRRRAESVVSDRVAVGEQVGCVALTAVPDVVVAALRSGWYWVNLESGVRRLIAKPEPADRRCRFNDGAVDPAGRLWTGSLHDGETEPVGRLYCLGAGLAVTVMDEGFICSNGIDWSLDCRWMYFVDSRRDTIFRYSYDGSTGKIGPREPFIDTSALAGVPDGLTVDADGVIWCAFWDGGAIRAFGPDGALLDTLPIPAARPTSITFGGPDLRTMYVTTAAMGPSGRQIAGGREAGSVLTITGSSAGRPANIFAGPRIAAL
jgi:sugar lactone lactonase YvrE